MANTLRPCPRIGIRVISVAGNATKVWLDNDMCCVTIIHTASNATRMCLLTHAMNATKLSASIRRWAFSHKYICTNWYLFCGHQIIKNCPYFVDRIYHTRRSIGMRHVSYATNAVYHWSTSNLARKLKKSTVAIATIHNLHHDAMVVAKFFVRVSTNILLL